MRDYNGKTIEAGQRVVVAWTADKTYYEAEPRVAEFRAGTVTNAYGRCADGAEVTFDNGDVEIWVESNEMIIT